MEVNDGGMLSVVLQNSIMDRFAASFKVQLQAFSLLFLLDCVSFDFENRASLCILVLKFARNFRIDCLWNGIAFVFQIIEDILYNGNRNCVKSHFEIIVTVEATPLMCRLMDHL